MTRRPTVASHDLEDDQRDDEREGERHSDCDDLLAEEGEPAAVDESVGTELVDG